MSEAIIRIAARGDGVSESGRHVALTAPGDRVGEGGLVEAGPHHAIPPCRHFPECGGCQLQHVDDDAYRAFLIDRVRTALDAQGVSAGTILPPHLSPPRSRRRASLHLERAGGRIIAGFKAQASHRIIDMRECHILAPELFALIDPLRQLAGRLGVGRSGAVAKLVLADQGVDLLLENVEADDLHAAEALSAFAARHRIARLSLDDGFGPQIRWEPEPVTVTLGEVPVPLPHDAFLQATRDGEEALVAAVREAIGDARIVADLFCGIGTFALRLPGKLLAAEAARDVVLALKAAANAAQRPVFVDHRDLFRRPLTAAELSRFEAVVLDPPRAGAREQVQQIAESELARLAYVSCNPATFARDAAMLVGAGFRLEWIKPVGQFRWSTHVELVGCFRR